MNSSMTSLEKLASLFERFPGIGPRQARRFVYHLLKQNKNDVKILSELISSIQDTVTECNGCFRFFSKNGKENVCEICSNKERNASLLMVVERDVDIPPIERSGVYDGYYFVLGGTIPLLESEDTKKLRGRALKATVGERIQGGLKEVVLAFAVNPDGENTARYVESLISSYKDKSDLKITVLGRGLSTGSELEYVDPETIKNALQNRG